MNNAVSRQDLFVVYSAGFAPKPLTYFDEHRIACSDYERGLG